MRRVLLATCLVLMIAVVSRSALAQKDCGDGLPCGKLYWDLPVLPALSSPTPIPTLSITNAPTATTGPTAAPTATVAPTGTVMADFSEIADQMSTLSAFINATDVPVVINGTAIAGNEQYGQLTTDAGMLFGYFLGIQSFNFGGWTAFIGIAFTFIFISISIKGAGVIMPMIAVIFRLIIRIIEVIKKLIGL